MKEGGGGGGRGEKEENLKRQKGLGDKSFIKVVRKKCGVANHIGWDAY